MLPNIKIIIIFLKEYRETHQSYHFNDFTGEVVKTFAYVNIKGDEKNFKKCEYAWSCIYMLNDKNYYWLAIQILCN